MAASNWQALLAYVMAFGGLKEPEAASWLDNHCPLWRGGRTRRDPSLYRVAQG